VNILIYANIPGSDMSNTAISVNENTICINSFTDGIKHTAEVKIPPVRKETMRYKSNNGVLEISVKAVE
jgi:HSP20 family molecular chaperone IbpA